MAQAAARGFDGSGGLPAARLLRGGGDVRALGGDHPSAESSDAIKAAIDEAKKADAEGKSRVILFNLSGHGHFDLAAYDQYFAGKLEDFEYPREAVEQSMKNLPQVGA